MSASRLHARLDARLDRITALCRRYDVRRLDLFGSVAAGRDHDASDYDFLVEFGPMQPGGYADTYFGLLEGLQEILEAPVELVVEHAIRNPYFHRSVNTQREPLYAA